MKNNNFSSTTACIINIIGLGRVGNHLYTSLSANNKYTVNSFKRSNINELFLAKDKDYDNSSHNTNNQLKSCSMICVKTSDLLELMPKLNNHHCDNLVFMQNGLYDDLLNKHLNENKYKITKIILYLSISKIGSNLIDGKLSVVNGPMSNQLISIFKDSNIKLAAVNDDIYLQISIEKMIWLSIFSILCTYYDCSTNDVLANKSQLLTDLTIELIKVAESKISVKFAKDQMLKRIFQFSKNISKANLKLSIKEFNYRNGWFLTKTNHSRKTQMTKSLHYEYLKKLKII